MPHMKTRGNQKPCYHGLLIVPRQLQVVVIMMVGYKGSVQVPSSFHDATLFVGFSGCQGKLVNF
jgi:hypothetical protein